MGKSRGKPRAPAGPSASKPGRGRALAAFAILAIAGVLAWATWRPAPTAPSTTVAASPAAAESSAPAPYAPLIGSWVRPDGGYELSISGVAPDGTATVAYFNPRPIRVARAVAREEDGRVGLFVEFDHPDYPGSTYTLAHDPASDTLKGVYYQAVQRAHYDVEFHRRR